MRLLPVFALLLLTACDNSGPATTPDAVLPDGGHFRGEQAEGRPHGQGRISYPSGGFYEGQFHDGRFAGHGVWQGASGDRYEGEFRDGLFHGLGHYQYADGARYRGEFRLGRMHGVGVFEQEGLTYRGALEDDRYHGEGVLELPGERFSGTFRAGQLEGLGEYRNDDGDHYAGEFAASQFHGQGRYRTAFGEQWSGQFAAGEPNGPGEHLAADGSRYQGELRQWRYQGQGRLERADGSVYTGQFSDGRFAGEGEQVLADGTRRAGIWRQGRLLAAPDGRPLADPLDLALLEQGRLLADTLAALPPSTSAAELYSLIVAGDGRQSVFLREADFVGQLLAERFAAHGQISLVNHRDHLKDRPMATRESLSRAIQALAANSGEEDLILLYLTSHGSADHELILHQPGLSLADLPAGELAWLLEPLAERNKIVIVSACYSGGFIPVLADPRTLVITAARADRTSFGCSETSDFTYFGRALFAEALQETRDLGEAFGRAREQVALREEADAFEASEPQMSEAPLVLEHWRRILNTEQRETP
ncbi:C13 family peptidase [Stutzerimonas tarimensis]|uniref:C13 family peptidase n=1 Tax=Stutzerimonas tarimensis TaxID=1507735 RepID=A0ABV7T7Q3_9GAMM